ncbi:MAG: tetratricopeptide repeat protein [Bacteroidia bacterium]|nr:tetratricopeptide repeat protein [Bacteroidia bacterium]
MRSLYPRVRASAMLAGLALTAFLAACTDPNVINKTTYNGQKITNTCDQFKAEVNALIEANTGPNTLRVAQEDNSAQAQPYLEPGQFELRGDTLYFRLINDLEYTKYLKKGVTVQVKTTYLAQDHLTDLEKEPQGSTAMLEVTEAYIQKYGGKPIYKVPVPGGQIDGKQISMSFSVVQKKGSKVKVFCETDVKPIGPVDPPCCTDQPWSSVKPKSVVQLPAVKVNDETYKFRSFVGTMDLIHPELKTTFDEKEVVNVIENYLTKYQAEGYTVSKVDLMSFASQGGTVELNQNLSEARSEAVYTALSQRFEQTATAPKGATFTKRGNGEDWERFNLLVKTADLTEDERNQVLAISGNAMGIDEKEAELRKLKFWKKLVEEVLIYCRHTFVSFNFDYTGKLASAETYGTQVPIISPELYNVATSSSTITAYAPGVDVAKNMDILNKIITANPSNANLYAMRSTYHYAKGDIVNALKDIEQAQSLDRSNKDYAIAALAYKTENAYAYSVSERAKLLNTYNDYVARYPDDKSLVYNRAVLMDRIGFITGAMAEYATIGDRDAIALNNRGVAKLKTNRVSEAEADFEKATQLNAQLPHAHYNLGIVYAYKGLAAKSAAALEKAFALMPSLKSDMNTNPVFSVVRNQPEFAKFK